MLPQARACLRLWFKRRLFFALLHIAHLQIMQQAFKQPRLILTEIAGGLIPENHQNINGLPGQVKIALFCTRHGIRNFAKMIQGG